MGLLLEALRIEETTLEQRACKKILGVAYQLLAATWTDLTEGRWSAAMNHRRPVWEAYEYAGAAAVSADFADLWLKAHGRNRAVKVETARRFVRNAFNSEKPGYGTLWMARRQDEEKFYQQFSHVSYAATVGITDIHALAAGEPEFAPQGYYSRPLIGGEAALTTWLLVKLLGVALAGLKEHLSVDYMKRESLFQRDALPALDRIIRERADEGREVVRAYLQGQEVESSQSSEPEV